MPVSLLLTDKLVENMIAIVQAHQLPCSAIIIEVTETTFMSNLAMSLGTLARLRLRGFGIAMDDYGTGYSSMKQLSRCPFTEIKIDKEFVHDAHSSPKKLAILTSAIVMSQKLNLKTVAEGVETEEDWNRSIRLKNGLPNGRPERPESCPFALLRNPALRGRDNNNTGSIDIAAWTLETSMRLP